MSAVPTVAEYPKRYFARRHRLRFVHAPIEIDQSHSLVVQPRSSLMAASIRFHSLLQGTALYQKLIAQAAEFFRNLPANASYDSKVLTDPLFRSVFRQLGCDSRDSFEPAKHRDRNWEMAIQVIKERNLHDVPAVATAALEQLKQLRIVYDSDSPIKFISRTIHEDQLDFGSYRGRVVLIHFWRTECPDYDDSISSLKKLHARWHIRGFEIIGVIVGGKRSGLLRRSFRWPQVYESKTDEGALHRRLKVQKLPHGCLFDKSGWLVCTKLNLREDQSYKIHALINSH